MKKAVAITMKLEQLWSDLRVNNNDLPAAELLVSRQDVANTVPTLTEAFELYYKVKGQDKSKTFFQSAERIYKLLKSFAGDLPLDKYTRADANGLRDKLLKRGLAPQSIKRSFSILIAAFNITLKEHALTFPNVFAKIEFGKLSPVRKRRSIPVETIKHVQALCRAADDPKRWLISLISDTGLRLSEALGLAIEDIKLDCDIPHVVIKEHPWRKLKTDSSTRKVSLVGSSLWAADRIVSNAETPFAFPDYTNKEECKANSASAALNKWLRPHLPEGCVIHSYRHSLRDRLRAVQCPADITDQIGGWSTQGGIGHSYGEGYPLEVLQEWMCQISINYA